MINRNEADVGLGPFALSYDRFLAVKATRPMYINYNTILVNYQNQKTDFYRYVYALQWEVWFGLVASLIIVSFVSLVSAYFMNDRDRSKLSFLNFLDHFTRMYGNIFSQASSVDINYNHQRVLRAFWWMAIIVLMQSFSGHLLATLVLDSNSQINDLRSLDRSGVLPGVEKGSVAHSKFKSGEDLHSTNLYSKMLQQQNKSLLPVKQLISDASLDLVKAGKFAVILDTLAVKYALSNRYNKGRECGFHVAAQTFHRNILVMVLRKGLAKSTYHQINSRISFLVESNILSKSINNKVKEYTKCLGTHVNKSYLTVEDLRGIFILLCSGLLLSFIIFLGERIHERLNTS
ncbi:glutamate receptor ionotropic, delta-2-like isoform X2 [Tachypleus tridentatus]|uniref:glutamate receptor ionotropic, delta-2-like isoform X2 n=2 Tax=Tachypleus tridentatus TaxID=6853 RepID=UPI003FD561A2